MQKQITFKRSRKPDILFKERPRKQAAIVVAEKTCFREAVECGWNRTNDYLPTLQEVVPDNLIDYQWEDHDSMNIAIDHLEGILIAKQNNLKNQIGLHREELLTIYEFDQGAQAVRILKQNGLKAKSFCFDPEIEKGKDHIVKGTKKDWLLVDIERTNKIVPTHALRHLNTLERNGLVPYDTRIAYALKREKTSREIARDSIERQVTRGANILDRVLTLLPDPVLIVAFGPRGIYVEIYRWN